MPWRLFFVFNILFWDNFSILVGTGRDLPYPDTVVVEFTREEYEEFYNRLVEYSFLKEQLEYHRKLIESHNRQMELILLSIPNKKCIEE